MSIHIDDKIQQQDGPGPFMIVLELVNEYGDQAIIEALAEMAGSLMEMRKDVCLSCQQRAAWLHMELSQLLDRYELLFPELEPAVNHEGPALIQ
jgi:hypothetical protein